MSGMCKIFSLNLRKLSFIRSGQFLNQHKFSIFSALCDQQENNSQNIFIPDYNFPKNESSIKKRARLTWQSRKRGIAENCLLFSTFTDKYLNELTEEELQDFDKLLNGQNSDWDIYYWMTSAKPIPEEYNTSVMSKLIQHCKNQENETRFRQPDLNYNPVK